MRATSLAWSSPLDLLEARAATPLLVREHSARLASWYNEPYNRAMLSNTAELAPADVEQSVAELAAAGGKPFLLFRDGALVGDGDFRHVAGREAEFAIMVGPREAQGQGLGTRLSVLLHAYAFRVLAVDVTYLAIVPANTAGRRCYEKVGYVEDGSCPASRYAEAVDDVTMSLTRARFLERHGAALAAIRITL